jgi:hypothetical protein
MSTRSVHSPRAVRTHLSAEQFARRPWRDLDDLHVFADEDRVEGASELGVAVPDQEPEGPAPFTEVHQHIPGLLGRPGASGVGGYAQDVHMPGGDLHHEQDSSTTGPAKASVR